MASSDKSRVQIPNYSRFTGLAHANRQAALRVQEGLAKLERTRSESAALRNLANASKMLENNPSLLQLRVLQVLGESTGNTVVFGGMV